MSSASINLVLLLVSSAFLYSSVQTASGQSYEEPKTFNAKQILPQKLQKGPNFSVAEKVSSDGYLYLFQVNSEYGEFKAQGLIELEKLIYEIKVFKIFYRFIFFIS